MVKKVFIVLCFVILLFSLFFFFFYKKDSISIDKTNIVLSEGLNNPSIDYIFPYKNNTKNGIYINSVTVKMFDEQGSLLKETTNTHRTSDFLYPNEVGYFKNIFYISELTNKKDVKYYKENFKNFTFEFSVDYSENNNIKKTPIDVSFDLTPNYELFRYPTFLGKSDLNEDEHHLSDHLSFLLDLTSYDINSIFIENFVRNTTPTDKKNVTNSIVLFDENDKPINLVASDFLTNFVLEYPTSDPIHIFNLGFTLPTKNIFLPSKIEPHFFIVEQID